MHTDAKPSMIRWIVGLGSLALAVFFALLGGAALQERETLWQLQLGKQHELQRLAMRSAQLNLENQAKLLAQTLAADAWLVDLVRQAIPLERDPAPSAQTLQAIRDQLFNRLAPRWRILQASCLKPCAATASANRPSSAFSASRQPCARSTKLPRCPGSAATSSCARPCSWARASTAWALA